MINAVRFNKKRIIMAGSEKQTLHAAFAEILVQGETTVARLLGGFSLRQVSFPVRISFVEATGQT